MFGANKQSPFVHIRQLASLFAPVLILKPLEQCIQNWYSISTHGVVPFNSLLLHFDYCPAPMIILLISGYKYVLELEGVFTRNLISPVLNTILVFVPVFVVLPFILLPQAFLVQWLPYGGHPSCISICESISISL